MVYLLRICFAAVIAAAVASAANPFGALTVYAAESEVYNRIVFILNGGRRIHKDTSARTVEEFLESQGIEMAPHDTVYPYLSTEITAERLTIRFDQGFYVDYKIDGEEFYRKISTGTTVGDFINILQSEKDMDFTASIHVNNVISRQTTLDFTSIRTDKNTIVSPIPFHTEIVTTPNLSAGVEQLRQEGVAGEMRSIEKVIYVGNEVYSREIVDRYVIEPVPEIIDKGVGGALGTLTDTSCPTFTYIRRLTMNASAYTAGVTCTGKDEDHPLFGITASGMRVERGVVSVDTSVIPLGTRLYVEGYGFAIAADTGASIRGYKIDLFMYDLDEVWEFGRRDVTVFILEYPN